MNEVTETTETSNLLIISDEELDLILAQLANTAASNETMGTPYISIKNSKFTLNDEKLGTSIDVVVLATAFDNAYYDRPYNPDVIASPACFALAIDADDLEPDEDSPDVQAESCAVCPMNEFGSAENGKGKACKNGRRLLVATIKNGEVDLSNIAMLKIPPTSLKNWATYVRNLNLKHNKPAWSVLTNLTFDEDATWPLIKPSFVSALTAQDARAIIPKLTNFNEEVLTPYNVSNYEAYEAPPPASEGPKKSKMS